MIFSRKTIVGGALMLTLCLACSNENGAQQSSGTAPVQGQTQSVQTQAPRTAFSSISPEQAAKLMQSRKDLMVIDVRSPQELRQGKIQGSILIPFWNILKGNHQLPKDRPLLLVCAVGGRSFAVGQYLARTGYPEIYNLSGGMDAWKKARYPVVY